MVEKEKDFESTTQLLKAEDGAPEVVSLRKCQLSIIDGDDKGTKYTLSKNVTQLGKKEGNDIPITDKTVSRNHAEIEYKADSFLLRDLESTNGTYVNGTRVKEAYLVPGDRIKIGRTVLEFSAFDEKVKIEPSEKNQFGKMVGSSMKMRQIFTILERIAPTLATVVIEGDTGTGKDLVAQAVHEHSPRRNRPFVVFDCSAVAPNLIESELFGYEEGAFTGSKKGGKAGRFEIAHKGTIFLDEIDSTPEEVQTRLLRVLQEKEVMRLGGDRILPVDVRVIGAASHDLSQAVQEGTFRADLYFRLNVLRLQIPPLRNRLDDIPLLLEFFNELFTKRHKLEPISIPTEYLESLILYPWPGNVRQIRNFVERLVINYSLNSSKKTLEILRHELIRIPSLPETEQLPDTQEAQKEPDATPHQADTLRHRIQAQTSSSERTIIADALKQNRYVKSKTAEMLGISRTTLWRKMKEFDLD